MDRFQMVFQYFQSNSESVTNGICGLLALASVKIYTIFDFNCPCLVKYNMAYGLGIMFIPPVALFLCGIIINRQFVMMLAEWRRPTGDRRKNPSIIRYMCSSVMQRAMIAPTVWILVALLDGKCFVCAFSSSIDPEKFPDFAANITSYDALQHFLAKIPCKHDELMRNNTSRKAVSRYLKCCSQVFGWSLLLILIVMAFLARSLQPCFNRAAFLQTRYWSNYIDLEQKIFEETCCEQTRDFAHKCKICTLTWRRIGVSEENHGAKRAESDYSGSRSSQCHVMQFSNSSKTGALGFTSAVEKGSKRNQQSSPVAVGKAERHIAL
ncbi:calcium homeostasis modulator protein 3 [Notechis scutatus]|uniref:Calcium homeostasis modulator protein 3 n=1 Tax=Notechis scutatus TaxID=8663 RepID=A0A6J1U9H8_9SAUR|nr:calcium homeostasis modulator protein 3 [Notechis scutatus]